MKIGIGFAVLALLLLWADIRTAAKVQDPATYAASILAIRARRTAELADAIEAVSYQFIANRLLNDTLRSYVLESETYDVSAWNAIFSGHLEGSAETVPELKDAVFFGVGTNGKIPLTMSDSLTRSVYLPVKDRIVDEALGQEGRTVWRTLEIQGDVPLLLCARLVKSRKDMSPLGVLVLLMDPDRFARTVSGYSPDEGIKVTQKTDYSVLLDSEGAILSAADSRFARKPLEVAVPGWAAKLKGKLPLSGAGRYTSRAKIDGDPQSHSFWVVYDPVPGRDWLLVSVLPITLDALPALIKIFLFAGIVVAAYFLISARPREIRDAPAEAGNAGITVAPVESVAAAVPEEPKGIPSLPSWFEALSPKEQTVLLFLLTGRSNKEIGFALDLREQTVKNYLHAIYQRIGVQDRLSAILRLQEAELSLERLAEYSRRNPGFSLDPRLLN